MTNKTIAVLSGDGIGPEVMDQALRVLTNINSDFQIKHGLIGGAAYDKFHAH